MKRIEYMLEFDIAVFKGYVMIVGMLTGGKANHNKLCDDKWSDGTLIGLQPHFMTSSPERALQKEALEKSHCHLVNY